MIARGEGASAGGGAGACGDGHTVDRGCRGDEGDERMDSSRGADGDEPAGREKPDRAGGMPRLRERRESLGLALRERMPVWLQLRCGLEPRALGALSVVLVAAAVFAVHHFWTTRPGAVRAPETVNAEALSPMTAPAASVPPGAAPDAAPATPGVPADRRDASPGTGARVVVDVNGEVRRPGVLRLPAGSRVADALRAAGGVEPGADVTGLNRARVLNDGEQVVVGVTAPPGGSGTAGAGSGGSAGVSVGAGGGGGTGPGAPVSLSIATVDQLDTLPGVGPVLAQHIIDYRARHGGFRSVEELREVNGIGERRFADLQPLVRP